MIGSERTVTGMAEYIDKEAAIDEFLQYTWYDEDGRTIDDGYEKRELVGDMFRSIPITDVKENVKAEWIYSSSRGWRYCSSCKTEPEPPAWQSRCFCPRCGAQMMNVPDINVGEIAKDIGVLCKSATNQNRLMRYDKIRAMSVEELADYLTWHSDNYSRYGMSWLDWLKSPVEVEK